MGILEQLGLALGLASLAGVNLYLTVLLTGGLVHFDVLQLAEKYETLAVLGHPAVMGVAGLLFALEFFADKVPWVDSLWDSVHTIIRPVGGTLLALQALGDMAPHMQVIAGLLAGGAALTTHSAKASTRLLINHSPEPVSNIAMSVTEDIAVAGGTFLMLLQPIVSLAVFGLLLVLLWIIMPRIWGIIRTSAWLVWMKLRVPGRRETLSEPVTLPCAPDGDLLTLLAGRMSMSEREIAWTVKCISGGSKGIKGLRPNLSVTLVGKKSGGAVLVAKRRGLRDVVQEWPQHGVNAEIESRFLSENLTLSVQGMSVVLRFPRGESGTVETLAMVLGSRGTVETPAPESLSNGAMLEIPVAG